MQKLFEHGHALVIGVAQYQSISPLPKEVAKDARDVATLLTCPDFCGYPEGNVEVLLDEQATAQGFRDAMRRLIQRVTSQSTAVVYFSGHGARIETGPDQGGYLVPVDCDPSRFAPTAIRSDEFVALLRQVKAKRVVVLLDACHASSAGDIKAARFGSEPIFTGSSAVKGLDRVTYEALSAGEGRAFIASCRTDELSLILHGMENSLFTHYLLDGLRGAARRGSSATIGVLDVFTYVSHRVPPHASSLPSKAHQHPIFKAQDLDSNFPIALSPAAKELPVTRPKGPGKEFKLTGKQSLVLSNRLMDRWEDLATYFEIPIHEKKRFAHGYEPKGLLEWLDQRKRLAELRDAFNWLGWDDLVEELDRP